MDFVCFCSLFSRSLPIRRAFLTQFIYSIRMMLKMRRWATFVLVVSVCGASTFPLTVLWPVPTCRLSSFAVLIAYVCPMKIKKTSIFVEICFVTSGVCDVALMMTWSNVAVSSRGNWVNWSSSSFLISCVSSHTHARFSETCAFLWLLIRQECVCASN